MNPARTAPVCARQGGALRRGVRMRVGAARHSQFSLPGETGSRIALRGLANAPDTPPKVAIGGSHMGVAAWRSTHARQSATAEPAPVMELASKSQSRGSVRHTPSSFTNAPRADKRDFKHAARPCAQEGRDGHACIIRRPPSPRRPIALGAGRNPLKRRTPGPLQSARKGTELHAERPVGSAGRLICTRLHAGTRLAACIQPRASSLIRARAAGQRRPGSRGHAGHLCGSSL